ncbi:MAG TPA: extracellular solute-binding protein [Clostridiales bacterium]|nr:extracellular solute-binding protein [Clostridiales bacterium]
MATIKEVAKLAQVSIGTVSNVLNGKTGNEELIQRVESAMTKLSYRPDANARSLKNTKSTTIGLVLPGVLQNEYAEFLHVVEERLREKGYSILIRFSRNNCLLERKSIEQCMEHSVDGLIIYSAAKKELNPVLQQDQVPTVLVSRRRSTEYDCDCIVADYTDAFEAAIKAFLRGGKQKIGLILEHDLLIEGMLLEIYKKYQNSEDLIKIVDSNQEYGFQAMFELYTDNQEINGIIAGSYLIAQGVKKAMETLQIKNIPVIVIKESSWIEDENYFEGQISISQKKVGAKAVDILLDAIERPNLHESMTNVIKAEYDIISPMKTGIKKAKHDLLFAMFDCPSSRSLQMLSRIYEKESGTKITFDLFPYKELEEMLYCHSMEKNRQYDGFMMDITWLEGLIETGGVYNLDEVRAGHQGYFDSFVDGILKDYGMYVESLYAFPFMSGAQLLFYQRDLFEEQSLKLRFKRLYGEELVPPKTWAQFNLVAEFFTKSFNPQSPVKYGVSLVSGVNTYTTIGFLMHLWSYGSKIFDKNGKVVINNSNSIAALKNFVASYQYNSEADIQSWNDAAREFMTGNCAMVILYDSDAGEINNYIKSKVAGNTGYSLVPDGTPVLGGWSLGVNRYGKHVEDTINFLLWACGNQNGIPLSLLGGSTLRKEYYERADLENLEPWKPLILKSYQQSRKRTMPEILGESRWKNNIYTTIIPHEIMRVIKGEASEKEALEQIEKKIYQLMDS